MKRQITLRVLIKPESDGESLWWIAQCLEYDLATQARSANEVMRAFLALLEARVAGARNRGKNPFDGLRPAPDHYRVEFDANRELQLNAPEMFTELGRMLGARFETRVA